MSALEEVLPLTRFGWRFLPLRPEGKEPLIRHGVKDASSDPQQLATWRRRWPAANAGMATGTPGPTVADIDNLQTGLRALEALTKLGAPDAASARGRHLYLEGRAKGTVNLGYGELRGTGSYVVCPPSIHPNGKQYVWLTPPRAKLPPVPSWLVAERSGYGQGVMDEAAQVEPGAMCDHLVDVAVRLARAGVVHEARITRMLTAEFEAVRLPGRRYGGSARDTVRIAQWAASSQIADRERADAEFIARWRSRAGGRP